MSNTDIFPFAYWDFSLVLSEVIYVCCNSGSNGINAKDKDQESKVNGTKQKIEHRDTEREEEWDGRLKPKVEKSHQSNAGTEWERQIEIVYLLKGNSKMSNKTNTFLYFVAL